MIESMLVFSVKDILVLRLIYRPLRPQVSLVLTSPAERADR
jgi:hypothetical protein